MPDTKPRTQTILITGATGQQGQALIAALRPPNHNNNNNSNPNPATEPTASEEAAPIIETSEPVIEYRVLALTRNKNSDAAKRLAGEKHVRVVEGDLNRRESIKNVFEDAKKDDGIWGVFAVMAYPGLNRDAEGEERQGKVSSLFLFQWYIFDSLYTY